MSPSLRWFVVVAMILGSFGGLLVLSTTLNEESSDSTDTQPDVLMLNDEYEFAAIKAIHGQLDDNEDGSVDWSESSEFVQTELCGGSSMGGQQACWSSDKSTRFHQADKQITSLELWTNWHKNEVINWTNSDVVSWLEKSVGLPQYADTFRYNKITGRHLPKIAINADQILQNVLLIVNSQHKQKIQLRAMDVVLFGPPTASGYWKDAMLVLSFTLSVLGVVYALRQRQMAQSKIDSFLDDFRIKEEELSKLKSKLELEEALNREDDIDGSSGSPGSVATPPQEVEDVVLPDFFLSRSSSQDHPDSLLSQAQEENELLRGRVQSLETEMGAISTNMTVLRDLLQECSRSEWGLLDCRRKAAEEQMTRAQKVCDKIKKRRSTLFGTFHLANSPALEEAGLQITKAVNNMHAISEYFDGYHRRWRHIEDVCGYRISSSLNSPVHAYSPHTVTASLPHTITASHFHRKEMKHVFERRDSTGSLGSLSSIGSTASSQFHKGATFSRHRKSSSTSNFPSGPASVKRSPSGNQTSMSKQISTSSTTSSPENSIDLPGPGSSQHHCKLPRHSYTQSQLLSSDTSDSGSLVESEYYQNRMKRNSDPSPVHHSASVPVLVRKTSYKEAVETDGDTLCTDMETTGAISFVAAETSDCKQWAAVKGLHSIKEEKQHNSSDTFKNSQRQNGHKTLTKSSFSSDV